MAGIHQILHSSTSSLPLASDLSPPGPPLQVPGSLPLVSDLRGPEWPEFTKSCIVSQFTTASE